MFIIGLDVHKIHTQACILGENGEVRESRLSTTRDQFETVFGSMEKSRILLESSTESEWVARCLEGLGHTVIVADPNYAPMYGQRSRRVKTDKRDSRALALACETGVYRVAHRLSDRQRDTRATLHVRTTLVRSRARIVTVARALLRRHGLRVALSHPETFPDRVEKLETLPASFAAEWPFLRKQMELLTDQVAAYDQRLRKLVREDEVLRRLCTMPSIGPVTAVTFVSVLDTPERFEGPHEAEAYLGLVPSEWSSGEKQRKGRLTKAGHCQLRSLMVETALRILRSKGEETEPLREWARRIELRRGKKVAIVALARKLTGILFVMWRDGRDYDPKRLRGPRMRDDSGLREEPSNSLTGKTM